MIPKELADDFLRMVDTGMVQIWPQIVHLCESDGLTLKKAINRIAALDSLRIGEQEWYLYKMRSLLRAHFTGDEIMIEPVRLFYFEATPNFCTPVLFSLFSFGAFLFEAMRSGESPV